MLRDIRTYGARPQSSVMVDYGPNVFGLTSRQRGMPARSQSAHCSGRRCLSHAVSSPYPR